MQTRPIDELAVDSVTGVDVALPIAGAGGRSYAFVIDWHIRVLLALAWLLAAGYIYGGSWAIFADDGADRPSYFFLIVGLPALAIYVLYHPVLEVAMRGRTPGKRMAGVRIVTREGATPGVGAILIRNVFRLVDSMPAFYCLGLGVVLFTEQHVRIGDLAAGTLLVYEGDRKLASSVNAFAVGSAAVDAPLAELIDDVLNRWRELSPAARMTIGRHILQRVSPQGADVVDEEAMQSRLRALLGAQPLSPR